MQIRTFLLLVCSALGAQASPALEIVSFGPAAAQAGDRLQARWESISPERRERIQQYLFGLGLSSTGAVHLVGVYEAPESAALLQFQQLDLFGSRLFWTVLVDAQGMRAKVLHHPQADRLTEGWVPIALVPPTDALKVGAKSSAQGDAQIAGGK
jgi:hypothetical protein